jgi:hypothetical protein
MNDFLAIGMTHYPLLAGTDERMADLLRWTLDDPDVPAELKDPATWSESMRAEWGDDGGTAGAARHRATLREDLRRCRAALDEFDPDLVVVWGDDQYENFREEIVPPFCVLAYPDVEFHPFEHMNDFGIPNAWGLPDDMTVTLHGDAKSSRALADDLLSRGFDVAYSYQKRENSRFPHAIANTQLFLDYDHAGREFPYKIAPMTVNCYGQHAIVRRGGMARFAEIRDEEVDPVGPSPARCFALGRAAAAAMRESGKRVAFVASSSWSHAFLNDKDWHLRPDTAADERLYDALEAGDFDTLTSVTIAEIVESGQHEMLNWFCMLGAVAELGLHREWSTFRPSDVFNSNKCFAVYADKD